MKRQILSFLYERNTRESKFQYLLTFLRQLHNNINTVVFINFTGLSSQLPNDAITLMHWCLEIMDTASHG